MDKPVLVTYATKHGATAEIAQAVEKVLRDQGIATDLRPVTDAGDPAAYDAVVLGTAVYMGQWRKEAARYLEDNERVLTTMPVWLFASGPTGKGDPVELMEGWEIPRGQKDLVDRINPTDMTVFHGNLDPESLGILERWVIKNVKAPTGDFRDWEMITQWAEGIAASLQEKQTS